LTTQEMLESIKQKIWIHRQNVNVDWWNQKQLKIYSIKKH